MIRYNYCCTHLDIIHPWTSIVAFVCDYILETARFLRAKRQSVNKRLSLFVCTRISECENNSNPPFPPRFVDFCTDSFAKKHISFEIAKRNVIFCRYRIPIPIWSDLICEQLHYLLQINTIKQQELKPGHFSYEESNGIEYLL